MSNKAKIRFHCRRGMLELENKLIPFFDDQYEGLSKDLQLEFELLLKAEDVDLWDWLITVQAEPPIELSEIVNKVRHHVIY